MPVNPRNLRNPRHQTLLVQPGRAGHQHRARGGGGPGVCGRPAIRRCRSRSRSTFGIINLVLATFNLMPIPPLDGSAIVERFLPATWWPGWLRLRQYSFAILFLLVFLLPGDYLDRALRLTASTCGVTCGARGSPDPALRRFAVAVRSPGRRRGVGGRRPRRRGAEAVAPHGRADRRHAVGRRPIGSSGRSVTRRTARCSRRAAPRRRQGGVGPRHVRAGAATMGLGGGRPMAARVEQGRVATRRVALYLRHDGSAPTCSSLAGSDPLTVTWAREHHRRPRIGPSPRPSARSSRPPTTIDAASPSAFAACTRPRCRRGPQRTETQP